MDNGKEQQVDTHKHGPEHGQWGYSPEHDSRSIGNRAMVSKDSIETPATPELGRIINLEMPPDAHPEESISDETAPKPTTNPPLPNPDSQLATTEKPQSTASINKADPHVVKNRLVKLNQDGDIADFYEFFRSTA